MFYFEIQALIVLHLLILLIIPSSIVYSSRPFAKTVFGQIRGIEIQTFRGRTINAFYNIPYTLPLNSRRRFEEPKDPEPWYSVLDAGGPPVACPHITLRNELRGVENCLVLHIFGPHFKEQNWTIASPLFPVIVYIHGGAFYFLSGGEFGPRYLLDHDVVLVIINYRIGVPGFGSTGDHVLPGNLGLRDQIKALKWIQKNIHFFNGDKTSVTLVGMSSGAACVHLHYFSRLSKGLFHKGFMIGGTGTQHWSLAMHPKLSIRKLSKNVGCPNNSSHDIVTCLEKLAPQELAKSIRTLQNDEMFPIAPLGPVVDNYTNIPFLDESPYDSLRRGRFRKIPLLMSNVKTEGTFPGLFIVGDENILIDVNNYWYTKAPQILDLDNTFVSETLLKRMLKKIRQYYFGNHTIDKSVSSNFLEMLSDRYFLTQSMKSLALHARSNNRVFYYIFDYRGGQSSMENFDFFSGASHIDDLFYLFNVTSRTGLEKNATDLLMIHRMTTMLVSFAKTGIPSFDTDVVFLPVRRKTSVFGPLRALVISSPEKMDVVDLEDWGNVKFWESLS